MTNNNVEKRIEALRLRSQGMSYSQIKQLLQVSKSSLSLWLREYPLSPERILELRGKNPKRIERFRNTMRLKREGRLNHLYNGELSKLVPFSERELLIGGIFLYWGEGAKTKPFQASLSNTNPVLMSFFVFWLTKILNIPKENLRVRLHIYNDMDEEREKQFWSSQLKIPLNQFYKSYVKQTTLSGLTFKGYTHGTCNVSVGNRDVTEMIFTRLKIIAENYSKIS